MFRPALVLIAVGSAWAGFAATAPARAAEPALRAANPSTTPDCTSKARFHADLELDPTAYALDGFSLHVGLGWKKLRVDLGTFGLRVPEFVHRQPDFSVRADGYGVKVQYFPFAEQRGAFVGLDGAINRADVHLQGSQLSARDNQFTFGVNGGWRIDLIGDFYVTPWLGVSYVFARDDVTLADKTFASNPLILFPAVHLGYRLR